MVRHHTQLKVHLTHAASHKRGMLSVKLLTCWKEFKTSKMIRAMGLTIDSVCLTKA